MADEQQNANEGNIFDQAASPEAGITVPETDLDPTKEADGHSLGDAKIDDSAIQGAPLDTFKNPDGSYDVAKLSEAYVDLNNKYADIGKLREGWQKEFENQLLSNRPEKIEEYQMPELPEGFDYQEDIAENPMFGWWRETCYNNGKDDKFFQEGVTHFVSFINDLAPNPEEEFGKLGENATQRTQAVALWAQNYFPAEELDAVRILGTTAEGIAALERIMKAGAATPEGAGEGSPGKRLDRGTLDRMMDDPRYHDSARRDPEWVKQVDEGFRKLLGR